MNQPHDPHRQAAAETRGSIAMRPDVEVSMLARAGDPSTAKSSPSAASAGRPGGVEWVLASELLSRGGRRFADLHSAKQEQLVKKMRHGMATAFKGHGPKSSKTGLPPASAFGSVPPQAASPAVTR